MAQSASPAYVNIQNKITSEECVILDGGVATEIERIGTKDHHISDKGMWGTWALYHAPQAVFEVHRRYAQIGCDVLSTNTC